jgi:hypothetical protein
VRTKYFNGVAKPVTAENSGHSDNHLIGNLLNTPILRKMDSSDYFQSMHTPTNCHISSRPYFKNTNNPKSEVRFKQLIRDLPSVVRSQSTL